jgi:phosphoribosylanthranilate isomerase
LDNARPGSGLPLAESEEEYEQLGRRIAASPLPVFLAGGINTNNIKRALALRPWCIDVSSGAETDGKKDAEKIQQLVAACREPKAANTARKPPNSPKEGA